MPNDNRHGILCEHVHVDRRREMSTPLFPCLIKDKGTNVTYMDNLIDKRLGAFALTPFERLQF
jgi:hypothetical protein